MPGDTSSKAGPPLRRLTRLAGIALISALLSGLSAGCDHGETSRTPRMNLITGSTGSSWYRIGAAIAERANKGLYGHPISTLPGAGGV